MFERFGPSVISAVLYAGFDGPNTTEPRKTLYENASSRTHAAEWLTEQYDRAERKETWSITMEVAITVFVAAELFSSIAARLNPTDGPPKTNRSSGGQLPAQPTDPLVGNLSVALLVSARPISPTTMKPR
jgi:hypothetical protein